MSPDTWNCPKCAAVYPAAVGECPICRLKPGETPPEPETKRRAVDLPPVDLPLVVNDARFILPFKAGAVWSMGRMVVTENGFALLCGRDALPLEKVVALTAGGAVRLGEQSLYLPLSMVKRVTHSTEEGFYIHAQDKKIEVRLPGSAWPKIDAACASLGVDF